MHTEFLLFTHWLHLHPGYGGLAAFLIAMSESIALVGTIIPGSITMTAIGVMIGSGILPLSSTLGLAMLGAILGDGGSYFLGYHLKEKLTEIWPFRAYPQWLEKGKAFFKEHGGKSIFIGRFIGPVRAMVPLIAGMLAMKPSKYFPVSIFSSICWAPCYLLPGYLIGKASTELPPFMATKIILLFFAILIAAWLLYWAFVEISLLIGRQVDLALTRLWKYIHTHRQLHWIYKALRSEDDPKHHGQLVLTFVALVFLICFMITAALVVRNAPFLHVNMLVYNFCRSIRTEALDETMVAITILGQIQVYDLTIICVFLWLCFRKHWRLAAHFTFAIIASLGTADIIKHLIHSARPTGIAFVKLSGSFPSGHATVATTLFGIIAWMLCLRHRSWRPYTYTTTAIVLVIIFISRLYLGAHWLTDVIGAFFLSMFFCMVAMISYERKAVTPPRPMPLFLVALISLGLSYIVYSARSYDDLLQSSQLVYEEYTLPSAEWWHKRTPLVPMFRANMAGIPAQVLNIQWAGKLSTITQILTDKGWHPALRKFPLLFNGERPVLVMEKNNKILYFWSSHITLTPKNTPLWIGLMMYEVDKKVIFHRALPAVPLQDAKKILSNTPKNLEWKIIKHTTLPDRLRGKTSVANYTILIRVTP